MTMRRARLRGGRLPGAGFAEVAERHLGTVHRYLSGLVRDADLAEELTGETFERALRRWPGYDPDRGAHSVWLCQIARSVALEHFRAAGRRRRREDRYAAGTPEAEPAREALPGLSPALRDALGRLTPAEREAVALRVLLELDRTEAAEVMGVSATACSTTLHRALDKLRRGMDGDELG